MAWYVLCTRDRYCEVHSQDLSQNPAHGYRRLAGPLNAEDDAQAWKFKNCRRHQPDPNHPPDWLCP